MTPFVKMNFICLRIKKSFSYQRLCTLSFVLKQGLGTTWNLPIHVTRLTLPTAQRQTSWIFTTLIEDLNKSSQRLGRVLNPGSSDCKSNALTARPRFFVPFKPQYQHSYSNSHHIYHHLYVQAVIRSLIYIIKREVLTWNSLLRSSLK